MPASKPNSKKWYQVRQLRPNIFEIHEPQHVSFFALKHHKRATLIDSGMGLVPDEALALLKRLGINEFSVLNTHAHCDHIGLNHLAKRISISQPEWKKFVAQNELGHLAIYHELLSDTLPWPLRYKTHPQTTPFEPTHFVKSSQNIAFGPYRFKPISVPGHTSGGLAFYEKTQHILFLGDLAYNGVLYFNLNDSSLSAFAESIDNILGFIDKTNPKPLLLPSHNDIPLDPNYLLRIKHTLTKLINKKLSPKGRWPFRRFFHPSHVFVDGDVRMVVRDDQA